MILFNHLHNSFHPTEVSVNVRSGWWFIFHIIDVTLYMKWHHSVVIIQMSEHIGHLTLTLGSSTRLNCDCKPEFISRDRQNVDLDNTLAHTCLFACQRDTEQHLLHSREAVFEVWIYCFIVRLVAFCLQCLPEHGRVLDHCTAAAFADNVIKNRSRLRCCSSVWYQCD